MRHADNHCDELLGAYVLGACPETEADGVAGHLAHCASCAAAAERLRKSAGMPLADAAPVAPATGINDRLDGAGSRRGGALRGGP